ncbi:hypothetical protein PhCBS80983_g03514 [Powellomyces hirtus]|uniref:Formate/nitrite transporter n=1 Tax=Powellomyces hirtus TaxID=109895 RepID=A0A507E221_9FUNG|nr:hypothetical protein PhCBS80983_g03514 [Powellomyces hirtus]
MSPNKKLVAAVVNPTAPVYNQSCCNLPAHCAPLPKTYVAQATARNPATGVERRATISVVAPHGAAVRVHRAQSAGANTGEAVPPLPRDYNTGAELEVAVTTLGITKSRISVDHLIFLGLLAGIWVAFAGMFAQQIVGGVPANIRASWPVLSKLLLGVTFPVGIVFIVLFGGELFTGNTMIMVVAWLNRKVTTRDVMVNWTVVFCANFAACALTAYLLGYLTDLFEPEPFRSYVIAVATRKVQLPFYKAFLMGIPANALVCLSFFLGLAARDVTGKILGLYLPIATFAATGWEHCVANMYYIPIGWMYGAPVTVGGMLANIFAVALGNIVGGGLLIGGSEFYMYHWHRSSEPVRHIGKWGKPSKDRTDDIEILEVHGGVHDHARPASQAPSLSELIV